jgi:hypothetical protein
MRIIHSSELRTIIKKQWPELLHVWLFDQTYAAVDVETFLNYYSKIEEMPEFDFNKFDCDDFSLLTHARIKLIASKDLPHSIAFGEITVRREDIGDVHNLNVLISDDSKALLYEPQGEIFIDGANMKPFFLRM